MVAAESVFENTLRSSVHPTSDQVRRVALISLRFRPAFVSLLVALAKACLALGFQVEFILDATYKDYPDFGSLGPISATGELPLHRSYTHAFFFNVSPRNVKLAKALKKSRAKVVYIYHEPWTSSLNRLWTEGLRGGITGALAHRLSVQLLKLADTVVIPSEYGTRVYEQGDIRYNGNHVCVPLLFDDEAGSLAERNYDKQYFSYIGAICRAHAFDEFVDFMRYSFQKHLSFRFLIASSSSLPKRALDDDVIKRNQDKLVIQAGRPLQNNEINACYAESFCVWNLYLRSTQSAVLPKAFMFGTPVIATPLGAFKEFVKDGQNGKFIESPQDVAAITSVLNEIKDNLNDYSGHARQAFIEDFYYKSQLPNLELLLQES